MDVERLRELERYEADASELFEHRTDVRKVGRVVAPPKADAARHVGSYGYGADGSEHEVTDAEAASYFGESPEVAKVKAMHIKAKTALRDLQEAAKALQPDVA